MQKEVDKKVRREMPEEAGRAMLVPMGHHGVSLGPEIGLVMERR